MEEGEKMSFVKKSIKSLSNVEKLLLESGVKLLQKPRKQGKALASFTRYSRHAVQDQQNNQKEVDFEIISKFFESFLERTKATDDLSLVKLLLELLMTMYKAQLPSCFADFHINIGDIHVATSIFKVCFQQQIFPGVLIPCSGADFFNAALALNEKQTLNMVLMSTMAYGDTLGDPKTIQIKEVIENDTFGKVESEESVVNCHRLKECNIDLILVRGDVDPKLEQYCSDNAIYLIHVSDYETLFRIHKMTGIDILFDLSSGLNDSDVVNVTATFYPLKWNIQRVNAKKVYREKHDVCGYIHINDNERRIKRTNFYTIFLDARGEDLLFLKREEFLECLHRVKHLLQVKSLHARSFERIAVSSLEKRRSHHRHNAYECPQWLREDEVMFSGLLSEHLCNMFTKFEGITNGDEGDDSNVVVMEDMQFKRQMWKCSLDCVQMLLSTISFDNTF